VERGPARRSSGEKIAAGAYDPQTCTAESVAPIDLMKYLLTRPDDELASALWHQLDASRRQMDFLNLVASQ